MVNGQDINAIAIVGKLPTEPALSYKAVSRWHRRVHINRRYVQAGQEGSFDKTPMLTLGEFQLGIVSEPPMYGKRGIAPCVCQPYRVVRPFTPSEQLTTVIDRLASS